jgi:hypothetical protein
VSFNPNVSGNYFDDDELEESVAARDGKKSLVEDDD